MANQQNSIEALRSGDQHAATRLFARYFQNLTHEARKHLAAVPMRTIDEEDVALAALATIVMRINSGSLADIHTHDDLRRVLAKTVQTKATDEIRKMLAQKRGSGEVRGESIFQSREQLEHVAEGSDFDVQFQRVVVHLAETLQSEDLCEVAMLRLEGYTTKEIATQLGCSRRTIQRRLNLIERELRNSYPNLPLDHNA